MAWQKGAIQRWYSTQAHIDLIEGAAKGAANQAEQQHEAFRKRLFGEIGQVQKDEGRFAIEKYDGTLERIALEQNIWGKDAFKKITADGNADKPLGELLKLYPSRKSAAAAKAARPSQQ
jgi:DNA-binding PucR family transcriptional regulator